MSFLSAKFCFSHLKLNNKGGESIFNLSELWFWFQNLCCFIFWDQFKRSGFFFLTLCLLLAEVWLPNSSAEPWCLLGPLCQPELSQPAATLSGPSTETRVTCLAWAAHQAPCHLLLCWESPALGRCGGWLCSSPAQRSEVTCPGISQCFPFSTSFISAAPSVPFLH